MQKLLKDLFSNWKTVPNLLSFIRIVLVPFIGYYLYNGKEWLAIVLVALSGLSDLFDGKIARRFNQVSNLGKILDPIADKLTIITIAVIMLLKFRAAEDSVIRAFGWVFLVFLIKDAFMVVGGAAMIAFGIRPGAAEIYGKVSTVIFYTLMLVVIAFGNEVGMLTDIWVMPSAVTGVLVVIAAVATVVAFCSYIPGIKRQVKERFSGEKDRKEIIE